MGSWAQPGEANARRPSAGCELGPDRNTESYPVQTFVLIALVFPSGPWLPCEQLFRRYRCSKDRDNDEFTTSPKWRLLRSAGRPPPRFAQHSAGCQADRIAHRQRSAPFRSRGDCAITSGRVDLDRCDVRCLWRCLDVEHRRVAYGRHWRHRRTWSGPCSRCGGQRCRSGGLYKPRCQRLYKPSPVEVTASEALRLVWGRSTRVTQGLGDDAGV
jgi:hypothetical protein